MVSNGLATWIKIKFKNTKSKEVKKKEKRPTSRFQITSEYINCPNLDTKPRVSSGPLASSSGNALGMFTSLKASSYFFPIHILLVLILSFIKMTFKIFLSWLVWLSWLEHHSMD